MTAEIFLMVITVNTNTDLTTSLVVSFYICTTVCVGTAWYWSVFLVVNAALGAGLLDFPAAYHQCGGIVVAVSIQAVRLFFVCLIFVLTFTVCKLSLIEDSMKCAFLTLKQ